MTRTHDRSAEQTGRLLIQYSERDSFRNYCTSRSRCRCRLNVHRSSDQACAITLHPSNASRATPAGRVPLARPTPFDRPPSPCCDPRPNGVRWLPTIGIAKFSLRAHRHGTQGLRLLDVAGPQGASRGGHQAVAPVGVLRRPDGGLDLRRRRADHLLPGPPPRLRPLHPPDRLPPRVRPRGPGTQHHPDGVRARQEARHRRAPVRARRGDEGLARGARPARTTTTSRSTGSSSSRRCPSRRSPPSATPPTGPPRPPFRRPSPRTVDSSSWATPAAANRPWSTGSPGSSHRKVRTPGSRGSSG